MVWSARHGVTSDLDVLTPFIDVTGGTPMDPAADNGRALAGELAREIAIAITKQAHASVAAQTAIAQATKDALALTQATGGRFEVATEAQFQTRARLLGAFMAVGALSVLMGAALLIVDALGWVAVGAALLVPLAGAATLTWARPKRAEVTTKKVALANKGSLLVPGIPRPALPVVATPPLEVLLATPPTHQG